ncbi:MAG TPA: caspase family protein [Capsulimonadaceae bacterium]
MKPFKTLLFLFAVAASTLPMTSYAAPAKPGAKPAPAPAAPAPTTESAAPTGTKRIVTTAIAEAPAYAKYALVIGVTEYQAASPLSVCGKDAIKFASMLKSKYGFQNVVLMTDEPGTAAGLRPTQRNIEDALDNMYGSVIPGKSEVVFFYSGHGTRAPDATGADTDWLVPEDGRPNRVAQTCINYDTIRRTLDTKTPKRVMLITDACRDLLAGKGVGSSHFGGLGAVMYGSQVAEFQSCQPKETSLEGDPRDFKESVFTHYLIRGMSGDPDAIDPDKGVVTFDSLKQYVQYSVRSYSAKLNSVQTPDGRATLGGMVIAKAGGAPPPTDNFGSGYGQTQDPAPTKATDPLPPIVQPRSATPTPAVVTQPSTGAPRRNLGANSAFKKAIAKMITDETPYNEASVLIKKFVDDGADINVKDSNGYPALVAAAFKNNGDLIQALVDNGANVNAFTDAPGASAGGDDVSLVPSADLPSFKVDTSGASLNSFDPGVLFKTKVNKKPVVVSGVTALMYAAQQDADILGFLLDHGADKNIKDNTGKTALDWAKGAKKSDCVKALSK